MRRLLLLPLLLLGLLVVPASPASAGPSDPACANVAGTYVRNCWNGADSVEIRAEAGAWKASQVYVFVEWSANLTTWSTLSAGWLATNGSQAYTTVSRPAGAVYWRVRENGAGILAGGTASSLLQPNPPRAATTCASSFLEVTGSITGTTASVSFRWAGTIPTAGWRVYVPDFGDGARPASPSGTIAGTATASGRFSWSGTVTAGSTTFLIDRAGAGGCYFAGTFGSAESSDDFGSVNGAGCGLNPFCYTRAALTWAFQPSSTSLSQFSGLGTTLSNAVPFGYVIGGASLIRSVFDQAGASTPAAFALDFEGLRPGQATPVTVGGAGDASVGFLTSIRPALEVAVWLLTLIPLVLYVWRKLFPAVDG